MTFLKVKCKNCAHIQIVYDRAAMIVKCEECRVTMQKPRGGKAQTRAEIMEELK